VASSALQIERVCALFSLIQEFVNTETIKPELAAAELQPLIEGVVNGVDLLFKEGGMRLIVTVPKQCDPVLIDRARTASSLSRILLIAHSISRSQDTIELVATPGTDTVQVEVRISSSSMSAMPAEARISMAVEEANFESQNANFSWNLRPFGVQIELQKVQAVNHG
jgi:hypothetical protein